MVLQQMVSYEDELKKNPELIEANVQMLREWCSRQPHLPKMSDNELVLSLHSNYYCLEPTKTTIDTFYTVRTHVPEFFSKRDPLKCKELRKCFDVVSYFMKIKQRVSLCEGEMLKLEPRMTIEEELKKNPEVSKQDIQALKEWCKKQPHLPQIEDVHLLLFLHSNYFRMEPTKTTIENYFTVRTHVPEFFANRDPLGSADLRKIMKVAANIPLKLRTKEGYTIMFGKLLNTDPASYDFNVAVKLFFMVADIWMNMIGTSNGFIYVADATGVSFGHVKRLSIMSLKKLLFYIQEAAPVRLKGIHFINTVPVMETILNMSRPFMKKELLNMVHFHSTLKTLEEYMPVEALPNEVGGKAGALDELNNTWLKIVDDNREWFIKEEATGRVNESLRIGKAQTAGDLFGVEGSFKKLDID